MRTSGSWFSLYSKVRGTVIFIRRLEIGTTLGGFLCINIKVRSLDWELERTLGNFFVPDCQMITNC
ncbi:hypothetical protein, partial [Streptococcus suis]|uniref:hypothetical protein n=1 Tax=Streptococcus suis TaxID=1307 RepID=UPI001EDF4723